MGVSYNFAYMYLIAYLFTSTPLLGVRHASWSKVASVLKVGTGHKYWLMLALVHDNVANIS